MALRTKLLKHADAAHYIAIRSEGNREQSFNIDFWNEVPFTTLSCVLPCEPCLVCCHVNLVWCVAMMTLYFLVCGFEPHSSTFATRESPYGHHCGLKSVFPMIVSVLRIALVASFPFAHCLYGSLR